ncbi:MAG: O-methyltransferase [Deltaproteobacteria bacterium]|nr:O-methyltransferase [Deltaproteobacteria bacterium]
MADDKSRSGVEFYADKKILDYLATLHAPHDQGLAAAFDAPGVPRIMVGPSEGKLLTLLVRLANAKIVVEVGTLAGYSAIRMAAGLRPGGRVYSIEYEQKHADLARAAIERAGMSDRIEVIVGAALEVLPKLDALGPVDVVFIDADKGNYDRYGEWAERALRPGGLLLGDNAFYFGRLLEDSAEAKAMRRFHERATLAFDTVCVPTPDGLLVGIKR